MAQNDQSSKLHTMDGWRLDHSCPNLTHGHLAMHVHPIFCAASVRTWVWFSDVLVTYGKKLFNKVNHWINNYTHASLSIATVDGRNPAAANRLFLLYTSIIYIDWRCSINSNTYQLVQIFSSTVCQTTNDSVPIVTGVLGGSVPPLPAVPVWGLGDGLYANKIWYRV